MATQYKQWQTDYDKAVTDRAKQVLTSEQFKSYKEYQDWQAEMRNGMPMLGRPGLRNGIIAAPVESSGTAVVSGTFYNVAPALPAPPPPPDRK